MLILGFTLGLWEGDAGDGAGRWAGRVESVESFGWARKGGGAGGVSRAFEQRSGLGLVGLAGKSAKNQNPGFL